MEEAKPVRSMVRAPAAMQPPPPVAQASLDWGTIGRQIGTYPSPTGCPVCPVLSSLDGVTMRQQRHSQSGRMFAKLQSLYFRREQLDSAIYALERFQLLRNRRARRPVHRRIHPDRLG